jgi:hypothetical protein
MNHNKFNTLLKKAQSPNNSYLEVRTVNIMKFQRCMTVNKIAESDIQILTLMSSKRSSVG